MATTVIAAFEEFQREKVNLDSGDSALGRKSRDALFETISKFPDEYDDFPLLYEEKRMPYGSFSRRTKIRPLDDIDMISCLHANGATYISNSHDDVRVTVSSASRLSRFCHEGSEELNSTKVINKYVAALSRVSKYRRAEINRRGEAATLQLSSYDWNFDVVPAFFTTEEDDGRTYYLIPNGNGHWKKTDPRIDRDRVQRVNQQHGGNMLNILRCIKYWQRRPTMVSMPSYLLESIVVSHFEAAQGEASEFVDIEIPAVLREIGRAVVDQVPDPKEIQLDINSLDWEDRLSIRERALRDAATADDARRLEGAEEMKASIGKWREIFGDDFPEYAES